MGDIIVDRGNEIDEMRENLQATGQKGQEMKISKFEKQLIKGLITMYIAKGIELDAGKLENELRRITGENDGDHRMMIEEYIEMEIAKIA